MMTHDDLIAALSPAQTDLAYTLPAELYFQKEHLNLEHQAIFENSWQMVAHQSQLPNPGDQLITQVGRIPLVLVRNQDHQIKAFHNVCRHRAGPVATKNCNQKNLRCKYHGWTYDLDGNLKAATEMNDTPGFDKKDFPLPSATVQIWSGFVFVNINSKANGFAELFEGIQNTIAPIDLLDFQYHHRDEYRIKCNWKVYMDNYLEGYHLPHVHPGLNRLLDYKSYTTTVNKWYSYQHSPIEGENSFYGAGQAHYYCIYPNLMLNILPDRLQTNIITPIDERNTLVVFDYFYRNPENPEVKKMIEEDQSFSDEVQKEDVDICERVQIGLESGSYNTGRLCMKRENGVLHFQNLIRDAYRKALK